MPTRPPARPQRVPEPAVPPSVSKGNGTRYTVLNARVLVETENLTEMEHDAVTRWMISRLKTSTATAQKGYVLVVVYDQNFRHILGSDSGGQIPVSSETGQIIGDLFTTTSAA